MKTAAITTNTTLIQKIFILFTLTFFLTGIVQRASAQTYKAVAGSEIKVIGTSNIHDWTMVATSTTGEAQLTVKGGQLSDITALTFTLPVKNLKGKEDLLNSRAYKAMKADKNPNITYKLSSATVTGDVIKSTGALTISGVTKEVTLQAKGTENADGTITVTGSRKIKMSEFGVQPPSFMLGALKVADEVTVSFTLKLRK